MRWVSFYPIEAARARQRGHERATVQQAGDDDRHQLTKGRSSRFSKTRAANQLSYKLCSYCALGEKSTQKSQIVFCVFNHLQVANEMQIYKADEVARNGASS